MKTVIIIAALLVIMFLVARLSPKTGCPKGYVQSPVNSTWAGWSFDCLPEGVDSTLVGIPADTRVPQWPLFTHPSSPTQGARTLELPPDWTSLAAAPRFILVLNINEKHLGRSYCSVSAPVCTEPYSFELCASQVY